MMQFKHDDFFSFSKMSQSISFFNSNFHPDTFLNSPFNNAFYQGKCEVLDSVYTQKFSFKKNSFQAPCSQARGYDFRDAYSWLR